MLPLIDQAVRFRTATLPSLVIALSIGLSGCGSGESTETAGSSGEPVANSSTFSVTGTVEERARRLKDELCPTSEGYTELALERINSADLGDYWRFACLGKPVVMTVDLFESPEDMQAQLSDGVPCLYDAQYRADTWMVQATEYSRTKLEGLGLEPLYCEAG